MNTQHHEVSVRMVNSYQSLEVINAFYALFDCKPTDIRIMHLFHPSTCSREVQVYCGDKLIKNHQFDIQGTPAVALLIRKQVNEERNYLSRLVLRDVYNFLQQNAIEHHRALLEKVEADYREVDDELIIMIKNVS
jgi:hypothetical protein